jgi:hypothetical protein
MLSISRRERKLCDRIIGLQDCGGPECEQAQEEA